MASQELGNLHRAPLATLTPGEPLSRSMGHYGKGHTFMADGGLDLTPAAPVSPIEAHGMSRHARTGGLATQAYPKGKRA